MTNFLASIKNRRSIYALGRNVALETNEIEGIIKEAIKASPTAFNAQSPRAVILFGEAHDKLWAITEAELKKVTPEAAFANTQAKLAGFKAGLGTVLFYKHQDTVTSLQEQFELYADNFPIWAEQSNGIATANVWVALNEAGLGANLQHYNPLIDNPVAEEFAIPNNWVLRSQLVFGSKEGEAGEKEHLADEERFLVVR
ncbi:MAG: nitroreductase family protein [Enterococcus sp.]